MKKIVRRPAWAETPTGLLVPIPDVVETSDRDATSYEACRQKGVAVADLYVRYGVRLAPTSALGRLIRNADSVCGKWTAGQAEMIMPEDAVDLLHLDRIASAILPLDGDDKAPEYLRRLLQGSLDLSVRRSSRALDALWELEVWAMLKSRTQKTRLSEPPDILVSLPGGDIGIACKKLYSPKNLTKVLSIAVQQVEDAKVLGAVAVNLDHFIPEGHILRSALGDAMLGALSDRNQRFIEQHERTFQRYMSAGRLA